MRMHTLFLCLCLFELREQHDIQNVKYAAYKPGQKDIRVNPPQHALQDGWSKRADPFGNGNGHGLSPCRVPAEQHHNEQEERR